MKRIPIVSIVCFLFILLSTEAEAQEIAWSAARPLTWDDFQSPRKGTKLKNAAGTAATGIKSFIIKDSAGIVVVDVYAVFDVKRSWKKKSMRENFKVYGLKHEQGHFDITEIHARLIRKKFSQYQAKQKPSVDTKKEFWNIVRRYRKRCSRYQKRYDRQTKHSINKRAQTEWNVRIEDWLKELKAYVDRRADSSVK
jgi:hypothetical protein